MKNTYCFVASTDEGHIYIDTCHNWIEDEPAVSHEEAEKLVGRDLSPMDYYEVPHIGGVIDDPDGLEEISIHDGVAFYPGTDDIINKRTVEAFIKKLQAYCDNYEEHYNEYVEWFRDEVRNKIVKMFSKNED